MKKIVLLFIFGLVFYGQLLSNNVLAITTPLAPTGLSTSNTNTLQPTFKWNAVGTSTIYDIQASLASDFTGNPIPLDCGIVLNSAGNYYNCSVIGRGMDVRPFVLYGDVVRGKTIYWRVRVAKYGINPAGAWTNGPTFTAANPPIDFCTTGDGNTPVTSISGTSTILKWQSANQEGGQAIFPPAISPVYPKTTAYNIQVATDFYFSLLKNNTTVGAVTDVAPTFNVTNLTNVQYYWRWQPKSADGSLGMWCRGDSFIAIVPSTATPTNTPTPTPKLSSCSTAVTPYVEINGGVWQQTSAANVIPGNTVKFGPQPIVSTGWSWTGPNGFSATTREVTILNVQGNQTGIYNVNYKNTSGCDTAFSFSIAFVPLVTTPTKSPTPTPPNVSITTNPSCICNTDNTCSTSCTFQKYSDITNYTSPIKCIQDLNILASVPTADQKNSWCNSGLRTKGDIDGNGIIERTDYYYIVSALNGGKIPSSANADVDGDGLISTLDRAIIIKSQNIN